MLGTEEAAPFREIIDVNKGASAVSRPRIVEFALFLEEALVLRIRILVDQSEAVVQGAAQTVAAIQ